MKQNEKRESGTDGVNLSMNLKKVFLKRRNWILKENAWKESLPQVSIGVHGWLIHSFIHLHTQENRTKKNRT